ncbi:MAG: hypothetical protein J6C23_04095 [Clostridia bacterium]|nr:hypothetical protein [Clostridia bacterium]
MFNSIKNQKDIKIFLDKTNSLHDGYVVGVQYINNGISSIGDGYSFNPKQTKLILRILVTSICDALVEIEFENLLEWQIKDNQCDIVDTSVIINEQGWIVWVDDTYINEEEMKKSSYAIAKSMKWRVVE